MTPTAHANYGLAPVHAELGTALHRIVDPQPRHAPAGRARAPGGRVPRDP